MFTFKFKFHISHDCIVLAPIRSADQEAKHVVSESGIA